MQSPSAGSGRSLREIKTDAVAASIAATALVLFEEKGFDRVTVDEIASASGISRRSFFRYFATKEDVVVSGHAAFGEKIIERVKARPADEDVWVSLRRGYDVLVENVDRNPEGAARTMRVINGTASLRAHTLEKHSAWAVGLAPEIARRLGDADGRRLEADALVHASFACLDVALAHFDPGGDASLGTTLDAAFGALRPERTR
ncbi:TetR family transcriptional regulator [Salinarimonas ramus]|uniref:TetR family transcriptional regulator n=1 Tax=Salinarimonas ramus TaxID=690164 RepID=A0A917V9N7_9HYPH|nr:TetR family transcriptional regulator [Salinarimonas ramus]GGK52795.1 TetR family transcriptional regulator [Salinarimonas ramus]